MPCKEARTGIVPASSVASANRKAIAARTPGNLAMLPAVAMPCASRGPCPGNASVKLE